MTRLASILIVATALAACSDDDDIGDGTGTGDGTDTGDGGETPSVLEWMADIVGDGIYSPITGTATVRQTVGDQAFTATAELRGDIPGSVRPWHVHFGTCGSGGGIVGLDLQYPRLVIDSDGADSATVRISVPLDVAAPYHVNIHHSDEQFGLIIACGDLFLTQ